MAAVAADEALPRARVSRAPRRFALFAAVTASGGAGLLWELLWQHLTSLSLGVSARGAAVTLAGMMTGFAIGALLAVRLARHRALASPLRAYAVAEIMVAAGGLLVPSWLWALAAADTALFPHHHALALATQGLGTTVALVLPAIGMGATIPILARVAHLARTNIATLYALNTAGAVGGVLAGAFLVLPALGVWRSCLLAAATELAVALWAIRPGGPLLAPEGGTTSARPSGGALWLAVVSGGVTFTLEVSWFRSARAAYQSTTDSFAVVLASFLSALALGAFLAPRLRRRWPGGLRVVVPLAALLMLGATPVIDQLDRLAPWADSPIVVVWRFLVVLAVVLAPITAAGAIFPWLLADHATATGTGWLCAVNTVGAVGGALLAAFVFLPSLGATRTSWLAAGVLLAAGAALNRSPRGLLAVSAAAVLGAAIAVGLDSGPGRLRVQGRGTIAARRPLFVAEGPDSTVSVVEDANGERKLVIDGFVASAEGELAHYMRWMGHLPALAAPRLDDALVICFGTGQTADAVRMHGPHRLDVVDLNAAVFRAARLFPSNHGVLRDPRVKATVMDGRAFLRRAVGRRFDLITLEPMPPYFAGTNSLYSREFYALMRAHLTAGGVVAQWVPFHLIAPADMTAIVATFQAAFPYARLFLDPVDGTGILIGGTRPWRLHRPSLPLDLSLEEARDCFVLDEEGVHALAALGKIITDDNQLLAYGLQRWGIAAQRRPAEVNLAIVAQFRRPGERWEEVAQRLARRRR
jgi:spermidine synthase